MAFVEDDELDQLRRVVRKLEERIAKLEPKPQWVRIATYDAAYHRASQFGQCLYIEKQVP